MMVVSGSLGECLLASSGNVSPDHSGRHNLGSTGPGT